MIDSSDEADSLSAAPTAPGVDATSRNDYLRELWYFAVPGQRLRRGRTMSITMLGEPLLVGRDRDGSPFALRDLCPHRGMPLSYGEFDGSEVQCHYHGWRFDTAGICRHIPSLVDSQRVTLSKIRVHSYPCKEVQGNIWVYFGDDIKDLPAVPTIPGITEKNFQIVETMVFPCDLDHAVIGLMDPAHGPFVHQSWYWRKGSSIHEKAKRFGPSHLGFSMLRHRPSSNSRAYRILGGTPETEISFQLPGVRIEHVQTGRHLFCGLTTITPISDCETRVHHVIYWTIPWLNLLRPLIRPFARAFLNQDRLVVTRQQDGLKHTPRLMLINDADMQARWYYRLKREFISAQHDKRVFENPVKECVLRWRS